MGTTPASVISNLPEPLHRGQKLNWNYSLNLIGEKVCDPDIHCCEICDLPILIYGRMLPCKHVFCYDCALKKDKTCPRCKDAVNRIERCELGTIFLCTWGAPRYSHEGCRRTYLSQRDLQAHINHRHVQQVQKAASSAAPNSKMTVSGHQNAVTASVSTPASSISNATSANGGGGGSSSGQKLYGDNKQSAISAALNPAVEQSQISVPLSVPAAIYSAPPVRHQQSQPHQQQQQQPPQQPQQQNQQRGGSRGNLITIQLQGYSAAKNDRRNGPQPKHLFR